MPPDDPTIPETVAGLAAMLRERARQVPPPWDLGPWDFLLRAPADVLLGPIRSTVGALTVDPDPEVRALALATWIDIPEAPKDTVDWLLRLGSEHADLFGEEVVTGMRLRERLIHSIGNAAVGAGRECDVVPAVLALVGSGPPVDSVGMLLSCYEPDETIRLVSRWSADLAHERFCVNAAISAAIYRRERLIELLRAMRQMPPEGKKAVLGELDRWLALDAEKVEWMCRTAGIAPVELEAPSMADCREAIG
jgi:hypothetical protein